MKAVRVNAFAPVAEAIYADVPDPVPAVDDLLIEVQAIEANFPDLLVMEGKYQVKPQLPFSPGKAAAGIVAAVGANVTGFKAGDRVAAQVEHGAYAQKLVAPASSCFKLPDGMPFDVAAALGLAYQTSYFALAKRASFKPGESVLVLGASGGVGSASAQLAKAMGAAVVIGGVLGSDNAEIARAMGCDHVVELSADDLHDRLRAAVHGVTDGRGCDIVIDPVGGSAGMAALRSLAWCGRMVVIGFASGDIPSIKANYLLVKNILVAGLQWSDYRDREPASVSAAQEEIFALWQAGRLSPHISKRLPLERFVEALEDLRQGRAQGKIILQPCMAAPGPS